MRRVAFIPARAGSKRIPGKNTRLLAGHPLLVYTVWAAHDSELFDAVYIVSDDLTATTIAVEAGALPLRRSAESATDDAPDVLWVREALDQEPDADIFSILRPTSPFRSAETIRLAARCLNDWGVESIRAVRCAMENPFKMWWAESGVVSRIRPFCRRRAPDGTPYHSFPSQAAIQDRLYIQTGGLEIAWRRVMDQAPHSISGASVGGLVLDGAEALDLNTEADWLEAERLVASGEGSLPDAP